MNFYWRLIYGIYTINVEEDRTRTGFVVDPNLFKMDLISTVVHWKISLLLPLLISSMLLLLHNFDVFIVDEKLLTLLN